MAMHERAYPFRWAKPVAGVLFVSALLMMTGVVGMVWGVLVAEEAWWLLVVGVIPLLFAAGFVGVFAWCLRSAFVSLELDGVRVCFRPSVNTTIPFADIEHVEMVRHHLIYGLGIRTNLAGHVALATAWGPAPELTLRNRLRTGILPPVWWTRARQLRLTVERPDEFVADLTDRLSQRGKTP